MSVGYKSLAIEKFHQMRSLRTANKNPFIRLQIWDSSRTQELLAQHEWVRVIGGVLTIMALSGVIFYTNLQFRRPVRTLSPEWIEAERRKEFAKERESGPPVELDPILHRRGYHH
ncbi:hypothetical protein Gasu2_69110 [Galdieria sulphuraria]|nr:hypothetical protein Gasu2_69110 [Galdieria sulphuraria]